MGVRKRFVGMAAAVALSAASLGWAASGPPLSDEQCRSLLRRLETDSSVYVGPAERWCLSHPPNPQTVAVKTTSAAPPAKMDHPTEKKIASTPHAPPQKTVSVDAGKPPIRRTASLEKTDVRQSAAPPRTSKPKPSDVVASFRPGPLSRNLGRFLEQHGWRVIPGWWNAAYDYQVVAPYTVRGKSVEEVLGKILKQYRLKARLYRWDRSVKIYDAQGGTS